MAKRGTETVWIGDPPTCDVCKYTHGKEGIPALYDGRMRGRTQWACFCEECWQDYGIGQLGTGYGQRLVFDSDK